MTQLPPCSRPLDQAPGQHRRNGRLPGWLRAGRGLAALVAGLLVAFSVNALTADAARRMAMGESDERVAAITAAQPDEATLAFLKALAEDAVRVQGDQVWVVQDEQAIDPVSGQPSPMPEDAEEVINNNRLMAAIESTLAAFNLKSADVAVRREAVATLGAQVEAGQLPLIDAALAAETDPDLRDQLANIQAAARLAHPDVALRIEAAQALSSSFQTSAKTLLLAQIEQENDPQAKSVMQTALRKVELNLAWGDRLGAVFSGISLGSILLLVALGLAITYGLMGVINMAHGELMMLGAYATYVVQSLFQRYLPGAFDWYLLAALPVAFGTAALMGAVLERGVIRFLYGRPLETLLATWGISLVLMQLVRSLFGAQNVGVENPAWMSGGIQVLGNLSLPYNRLVIIGFALAVLGGVAWLIGRTRLGLFVRGVTQNRPMAACMGVNTARIDTLAFALGSGIAGLAGCALSQIGNVGPALGQGYIVDAFMVVVLGGVGQLAGTVYAALGLGILSKFLEGWAGAVLAKIAVLVIIIVFIQKRPQGLFAMKGRSAEA